MTTPQVPALSREQSAGRPEEAGWGVFRRIRGWRGVLRGTGASSCPSAAFLSPSLISTPVSYALLLFQVILYSSLPAGASLEVKGKSLTLSSLSLALGKCELPLLIQRKCLWGERGPGDERIRHCLGPLGSSRWQN